MTTIAADPARQIIVCDSNVANGDQKWSEKKVEEIDGTFYGAAGDAVDIDRFYAWVRKGRKGRKPKVDEDEFEALALNASGLYWFDSKLHPIQMHQAFAIGSGGKSARAAMLAGATIERAVEIVCEVDAGSAMPLQIYKISDLENKNK